MPAMGGKRTLRQRDHWVFGTVRQLKPVHVSEQAAASFVLDVETGTEI